MKSRLLPLVIAAALLAPAAFAATPPADEAARRAELAKARAEMANYARRVAELSRELGEPGYSFEFRTDSEAMTARPGVGIVMEGSDAAGVLLAAVTPEGPAAKAGLRAGDILLSVDGHTIAGRDEAAIASARDLLDDLRKGQQLRLGYTRGGRPGQATVTVDDINRVMVFSRTTGPEGDVMALERAQAMELVAPRVRMELDRLGSAPCAPGSDDCHLPALSEAFRWNGLNLASLDAKLGHYFGTDRGVLVLSGGDVLATLEPGDVIRRIGGESVVTPRDAMRLLREHDEGDKVKFDVLRQRQERSVEVTMPAAPPLRWFAPPPPPAPPAPPAPPTPPNARIAPPAPPAPPSTGHLPAPPAPAAPAPPPPPPPPPDTTSFYSDGGEVIRIVRSDVRGDRQEHVRVIVTDDDDSDGTLAR